jgi:hypothetical protein
MRHKKMQGAEDAQEPLLHIFFLDFCPGAGSNQSDNRLSLGEPANRADSESTDSVNKGLASCCSDLG